jgi:hypothetical protein
MRTWLLFLLALALAGCGAASAPTRPADITGMVTRVAAGTDGVQLLVEENPSDTAGSAKASVRTDASTHWFVTGGGTFDPSQLKQGMRVSVWFSGPVATSYPVQAKGSDIVVLATSGAPQLDVLSKGGPAAVVRINGVDAVHVACNGAEVISATDQGTFRLPWNVQVLRESDEKILLDERVTDLPRWMLVTQTNVGISDRPIAGPYVAC